MIQKFICLLGTVLLLSAAVQAQEGALRGFVYEKESEAPIPFANISVKGTSFGAVANDKGYFLIDKIPEGDYQVVFSFVGYKTITRNVTIGAGRINTLKVYLDAGNEMLQDVEVSAERQQRETQVLIGKTTLDASEIKQFSVGGDADIIKAIQVLPGVVTSGDQGGQLYIRGGAPIQNLVLLDGMIVYNPFHSIGFFSVFDSDIIQSADVYTGGFNAEYGSRNSAVMDIRTRDGNRKRFTGKVSASTYTAKALLETPLGAKDENGRANTSLLLSAKTSYLNQTSDIFYGYIENEYDGLPFSFTDIFGKITAQSDNGSRISAYGFSFDDGVKFGGDNAIDWDALGGGVRFTAVPSSSSVLIEGDIAFSDYEIVSVENDDSRDFSSITSTNAGLDFTYFLRQNDEFKYGLEFISYSTELELDKEVGVNTELKENTTELGAFAKYKMKRGRFLIEPSFRLHYYASQSEMSPEPRLGIKYNVNEWLRLKASGGLYSQNLIAANNDRDVVNLFYGFLSGPEGNALQFEGEEVNSSLQKAQHAVVGAEFEVTKDLTLNIEGYVKNFSQLTNVNRNQIYSSNNTDPNIPEELKSEFIIEKGLARGVDLLAKYQTRQLYLWGAYSLSKVTRNDGVREYFPFFDRRHNLNLVANYSFGKDLNWEASVRYNFGSGFPFTPQRSFYRKQPFVTEGGSADLSYDYTVENGELDVLYGDLNTKRLPNYHRLDASIKRLVELKGNQKLELSAGATNILDYENIFYYDRLENKRVNQLPIMPTFSMSYMF